LLHNDLFYYYIGQRRRGETIKMYRMVSVRFLVKDFNASEHQFRIILGQLLQPFACRLTVVRRFS